MESANPDSWGSVTHEEPQVREPEAPENNVYQMYRMDWAVASDAQRDREEARQRRARDNNGGMGFPTDYGQEIGPETAAAQRPLSAAAASATLGKVVRLA